MALKATALAWHYSGGAANSDPNLSLGGAIGAEISSQSFTTLNSITGVTVVSLHGVRPSLYNLASFQELQYVAATQKLFFRDILGDVVPAAGVVVSTSGRYEIQASTTSNVGRRVVVDVVSSLLPPVDQTSLIEEITTVDVNLFDDVQKSQVAGGYTDYRCLYLVNPTGSGEAAANVRVYISTGSQQPESNPPDSGVGNIMTLDLDPAGIGDGTLTGIAIGPLVPQVTPPVPAEEDPTGQLAGLTWITGNEGGPLTIGNLQPGEVHAIWLRRGPITPSLPIPIENLHGLITVKCAVP